MTQTIELPRQPDAEGFYLHFTGGLRAGKIAENAWRIEPVLADGRPCATGPLTTNQLRRLAELNNVQAVAFQEFGWTDGEYWSNWRPINPAKDNHIQGPAALWNNISANIAFTRDEEPPQKSSHPTAQEVIRLLDQAEPVEALARYMSLSLRSMDISVEQIAEHYHEQLLNHMAAGRMKGELYENTQSQTLLAHIHSFFLHLGAARDYLGTLVALRVGLDPKKVDSMARLVDQLRPSSLPKDSILDLLFSSGNFGVDGQNPHKFALSGWMDRVTSVRNLLVHKRPYGSKLIERFGRAVEVQDSAGFFRYFRPLDLEGGYEQDILDFIHSHYVRCNDLFDRAAVASGYNYAMIHFTEEDFS